MAGLSSEQRLSFVDLRCGEIEYGSEECDVKRDVGHMLGPWNGHLGRLLSEHDSLDIERGTQ